MVLRAFLTRVSRLPPLGPRASLQIRRNHDGFARLNIYKDPAKAPKPLPDAEYPDWLWRLHDPEPTKEELFREAETLFEKGGYDLVFENMDEKRLRRLFKLDARERIKAENGRRRGGRVV